MLSRYTIECQCPAYNVGLHKARLINTSTNEVLAYGSNENAGNLELSKSTIITSITVETQMTISIQHRCQNTFNDGLGLALGFDCDEVYTTIKIQRGMK